TLREPHDTGDDMHRFAVVILLIVLLVASGMVFAQASATDSRINRRCPDATLGTDPAAPCAGEVLNDQAQQPPSRVIAPPNTGLSATESNRASNQSMVTPPDPSSSTVQLSPPGTTLQTDPRGGSTTTR